MTERTTSRVIPRPDANDSIPVLTEVFELPGGPADAQPAPAPGGSGPLPAYADERTAAVPEDDAGQLQAPGETAGPAEPLAGASEEDLRAVRSELLARVMMRFRTEWPPLVQAQTEAALQERLAPLATQIANELSRALEARLVEWLDATLEEIERDPGQS
ncbi:hypothetical protein K6V92_21420 [Cupriavidus respiraculi]|uniref:hypothetical protein n=1 Tax=Cupriavidus respiraculi TaxID=195930 RepID=UPI001C97D4E1|nr:hypothetical protein [Cupriavidus respiraculi]MBY4949167.1 hypothetical protein [Cupriavidus respiraculi]